MANGALGQVQVVTAADPLAGYHDQPVISDGGPQARYIGRVIIELWEPLSQPNDVGGLAYTSEAVDGNNVALLQRIARALPLRLSEA